MKEGNGAETVESKEIIRKINEIEKFLREHKRYDFANELNILCQNLKKEIKEGLISEKSRLFFFGGAGSLNDVYLCKENGDESDDFENSNRRLDCLRGELFELLNKLK